MQQQMFSSLTVCAQKSLNECMQKNRGYFWVASDGGRGSKSRFSHK